MIIIYPKKQEVNVRICIKKKVNVRNLHLTGYFYFVSLVSGVIARDKTKTLD